MNIKKTFCHTGISATAALLALSLTACSAKTPDSEGGSFLLAKAEYPRMAPYPQEDQFTDPNTGEIKDAFHDAYDAWWAQRREKMDLKAQPTKEEKDFYQKSIRQLLSGSQGENRVCSPLNIHLALGMLAELTGGESRQQILSLLETPDLQTLQNRTEILWDSNYCDDGAVTSVLANSLWLNERISFVQSTMNSLADHYHASSYQGKMGSADFDKALQNWLNEQTGGLLKEQAEGIRLDVDTVMALASTVYFRSKWSSEFSKNQTREDTFHTPGGEISCDFMHQSNSQEYFWGEHFSAASLSLASDGAMWFLLPDEGFSPEDLLADQEAMDFLLANGTWDSRQFLTVNLSIPKFDVSSDLNLIEDLPALGITDIFDPDLSDFSPMIRDMDGIFLSQAKHAARVSIDEEGCTAVAYTVMAMCGAGAPPEDEVDFVLNRPFLFVITGPSGAPLFAGIVNQPTS